MKIPTLLLFLSASTLSAAESELPTFSTKLVDRPELSLSEAVRSGRLPPFAPLAKYRVAKARRASPAQEPLVSQMPVIEPGTDVDRNMPVVTPRTDIDMKMRVKVPNVDLAK